MHSWGSCRCRYRREAVHFSVKKNCQRVTRAIISPRTYRAVLAESAGIAVRGRVAAEQVRSTDGLIGQRALREVLLRASEVAWLLSGGRVGRLRVSWRRVGVWAGPWRWRWVGVWAVPWR